MTDPAAGSVDADVEAVREALEKATPGPWHTSSYDRERNRIEIRCAGDDCANLGASVPIWLDDEGQDQADARLIAAAPTLAAQVIALSARLAAAELQMRERDYLIGQMADELRRWSEWALTVDADDDGTYSETTDVLLAKASAALAAGAVAPETVSVVGEPFEFETAASETWSAGEACERCNDSGTIATVDGEAMDCPYCAGKAATRYRAALDDGDMPESALLAMEQEMLAQGEAAEEKT